MNNINLFLAELESDTIASDGYRKHGETLLKYSVIQPNTLHLNEYISLNPIQGNRTGRWLCKLADKYGVRMTGKPEPFWVGPSIIKKEVFFRGMQLERMLKWYEHYGFKKVGEQIIREPKK